MARNRLHRTWMRLRSVPGLARNSAGVIGVVILGLFAASWIFGNVKVNAPWADEMVLSAEFESAPGIKPSQKPKVLIAGVDVGKVVDSEVTEDGTARLTFSLESGHEIYENSEVMLRPKSVLNEMYVVISPGSPDREKLESGDTIPASRTARPVEADEVLKSLDERTRVALGNLLSVSDVALSDADEDLPAGVSGLNGALNSFKPVVEALQHRRGHLARLVTAVSRIAHAAGENRGRTASLAASLHDTLRVLANRDSDLSATLAQLPGTTQSLRSSMGSLQRLSGQLNPTLDNVEASADELPGTLKKLTSTVKNVETTANAARPVVAKAKPLVADLRPLVADARASVKDLAPTTQRLQPATDTLMPYLGDLKAFVYNTSGVFAPADANGGFVRGHLTIPLPAAGILPGSHGGEPDVTKEGNR